MEDENSIPDEFSGGFSKINSAGIVNVTLNNLWIDFYRHYRSGQYLSANSDLDCIWFILGGEKSVIDSDEEKAYFTIEKQLALSGEIRNSLEAKGFDKVNPVQVQAFKVQKPLLGEKALFLRRLQNIQGKGTAYWDGSDEEAE